MMLWMQEKIFLTNWINYKDQKLQKFKFWRTTIQIEKNYREITVWILREHCRENLREGLGSMEQSRILDKVGLADNG